MNHRPRVDRAWYRRVIKPVWPVAVRTGTGIFLPTTTHPKRGRSEGWWFGFDAVVLPRFGVWDNTPTCCLRSAVEPKGKRAVAQRSHAGGTCGKADVDECPGPPNHAWPGGSGAIQALCPLGVLLNGSGPVFPRPSLCGRTINALTPPSDGEMQVIKMPEEGEGICRSPRPAMKFAGARATDEEPSGRDQSLVDADSLYSQMPALSHHRNDRVGQQRALA
jgi:hypothetical protein